MRTFIREFKDFILKGNVVDLAVAVIIGAVFGAVVKSAVDDVLMPPLGYLMGGVDFSEKKISITVPELSALPGMSSAKDGAPAADAAKTPPPAAAPPSPPATAAEPPKPRTVDIRYGRFLNAVIALVIQGFALFVIIKMMTRLKKPVPASPGPMPLSKDQELLTEIRDLLKRQPK